MDASIGYKIQANKKNIYIKIKPNSFNTADIRTLITTQSEFRANEALILHTSIISNQLIIVA